MVSEEGDSTPLAQDKFFGYVKTDFQAVYASEGAWCPKTRVFFSSGGLSCPLPTHQWSTHTPLS